MSNQSVGLDEDRKNKPWRPIPAGDISLHEARRLRWFLLAACLAFSARTGVLHAGAALSFATWAHNEANLGSRWLTRNALNAIGYVSFSIGASNVGCACTYLHCSLSPTVRLMCRCRLRSPRLCWCTSVRLTRRTAADRCSNLHHHTSARLQGRRWRCPHQSPDAPHPLPHCQPPGDITTRPFVVAVLRVLLPDCRPYGVGRSCCAGRNRRHAILV